MGNDLLKRIIVSTFSRSGLVHRIGLLKEFLEFVFFTQQERSVTKEAVTLFTKEKGLEKSDADFLQGFEISFFAEFTKENFYHVLDVTLKEVEALKTLTLIVPVELEEKQVAHLSQWVRKEVGPDILLSLERDSSLSVGCQIVWEDSLYDFSLEHYFSVHRDKLHTRLSKKDEGVVKKAT